MSENGKESRWRLNPLDDNEFIYFGLDVTNGNQAALFIRHEEHSAAHIELGAGLLLSVLETYMDHRPEASSHTAEVNGLRYHVLPWSSHFDRELVLLIDRLVHLRMANANAVSLQLQLEMPL